MKPLWIAIPVAAGVAQYFMLSYGVVMDTTMLANTMQTDPAEVRDLLGWAFLGNVLLVAALPAALVFIVPVLRTRWWTQVWKNAALFVCAIAVGSPWRSRCSAVGAAGAKPHGPALHRQSGRRPVGGGVGDRPAVVQAPARARADLGRRGAGVELCGAGEAAAVGHRRRRNGAGRSLLARRLSARHQPRAGQA
ncbi:MAG: DUF1705 domain-containing protein [Caldimonas sp.]